MAETPGQAGTLDSELRALGRVLVVGRPPAELEVAVLARIEAEPVPVASRLRQAVATAGIFGRRLASRWRVVAAVLVAALVAVLIATPASARLAEWLGLGGVVVVQVPAGGPPLAPADPAVAGPETEVSLAQAREQAAFPIGVPVELGDPDRVLITPGARVVSMVWQTDGTIRLDQFVGLPDLAVAKRYGGDVQFTNVGLSDALWLERPHPMVYVDAGGRRKEFARTSGPSLIWTRGATTLRLEGVADRDRALAIARSLRA